METETIFVERKTHREDWTGEKSVKARFPMKEKNVNAFLEGKLTVESVFEKMRANGKKREQEIADLETLAREVQYRVVTRKLVPVTRSFYNRTAFQLPGDARVRISLDTELTMTREDNLDGRSRAGRNWRRMDIGIDFPFSQLPPEDVERFPYAVLEVKLQTQAGQDPPEWVREVIASHLVEAVPKFSKFIHGTATLFPDRINLLPFWMPQMDIDIRKPVTHQFGIERPGQSTNYSTTTDEPIDDDDDSDDEFEVATPSSNQSHTLNGTEDNDDSDQGIQRLRAARDAMEQHDMDRTNDYSRDPQGATGNELDLEERIAALLIADDSGDRPIYDSEEEDEEDDLEEARRVGGWRYRRKQIKHTLQHHIVLLGDYLSQGLKAINSTIPKSTSMPSSSSTANPASNPLGPPDQISAKRFKAPRGKRIHVPVRVEPKVFFAAERTFLAWLEFSIILGSIAGTLLNFGDDVSLVSAWGFTAVAILALFYSLGIYVCRVRMLKARRSVRYHDKWGPTVLCLGLLVAVAVNFGLRVKQDGWFVFGDEVDEGNVTLRGDWRGGGEL